MVRISDIRSPEHSGQGIRHHRPAGRQSIRSVGRRPGKGIETRIFFANRFLATCQSPRQNLSHEPDWTLLKQASCSPRPQESSLLQELPASGPSGDSSGITLGREVRVKSQETGGHEPVASPAPPQEETGTSCVFRFSRAAIIGGKSPLTMRVSTPHAMYPKRRWRQTRRVTRRIRPQTSKHRRPFNSATPAASLNRNHRREPGARV